MQTKGVDYFHPGMQAQVLHSGANTVYSMLTLFTPDKQTPGRVFSSDLLHMGGERKALILCVAASCSLMDLKDDFEKAA